MEHMEYMNRKCVILTALAKVTTGEFPCIETPKGCFYLESFNGDCELPDYPSFCKIVNDPFNTIDPITGEIGKEEPVYVVYDYDERNPVHKTVDEVVDDLIRLLW